MESYPFMKGIHQIGVFNYEKESNTYSLIIEDTKSVENIPWGFIDDVTNKFIDPIDARQRLIAEAWVEGRIVQPDRQDIKEILEQIGLTEYNQFNILKFTRGWSRYDDYWIKVLNSDSYPVRFGGDVFDI